MSLTETGGDVQFTEVFDVESVATDSDGGAGSADELALLLKRLNQYRGTFGDGSVQGVFITDHTDNYRSHNVAGDDGRHVAALEFEVVGYRGG